MIQAFDKKISMLLFITTNGVKSVAANQHRVGSALEQTS